VTSIGAAREGGAGARLGVSAPKRAGAFPEIPTIAEAGVPGLPDGRLGG